MLYRYCTAVDTSNWPLLCTVFTETCKAHYHSASFTSAQAVADHMQAIHRNIDGCLHRLTNIVVNDLTANSAKTVSYVDALLVQKSAADGPTFRVVGQYFDELVLTSVGWRIAERRYVGLYTEGNRNLLALPRAVVSR